MGLLALIKELCKACGYEILNRAAAPLELWETDPVFLADCPNVRFFPGLFRDTLNAVQAERFALVHVDCDLYGSVAECCAFYYPRLSSGGFIVFDDYGFRSCPGAKQAVDEFFQDKPETSVCLPTGQCLLIKQGNVDAAPLMATAACPARSGL